MRVTKKAVQLLFFVCLRLFLDGLAKVACVFMFYFYFRQVLTGSDLLIWHGTCFHAICFRDKNLSYSTWNLALEALKHCIYTIAMSMVTKLDRVMTYHEELPSIKSHDPLVTWSCRNTWQTKWIYISTNRVPTATKLGRMVTYFDGLLPIKSNDPLITLFCKITWQSKTNISPSLQSIMPPNLAGSLSLRGYFP